MPDFKTSATFRSSIDEHPITRTSAVIVIHGLDLGRKYDLTKPETIIGRSSSADIQIDQEATSRRHACFTTAQGRVSLKDLGSTNGTYVNDEKVWERQLRDGDRITIGRTVLKFLAGGNIETAYHDEIYRLTTVDGLTRVFNRRYFDEIITREVSRSRRHGCALALVMIDIDRFKNVNDLYGHLAGDHALTYLASTIKKFMRREDILSRYGGDEFALLLPEVEPAQAATMMEKVRTALAKQPCLFAERPVPITVSAGIAAMKGGQIEPGDLVEAADKQLYAAKAGGRDRVSFSR